MTTSKRRGRPPKLQPNHPKEEKPLAGGFAATTVSPEPVEPTEEPVNEGDILDLSRYNLTPLGDEAYSVSAFLPKGLEARSGEFGQEVDVNGITYVIRGFVEWEDSPGRVANAKKAGWDFIPNELGDWGTPGVDVGQAEPGSNVINRPVGAGQTCYAMAKPKEWVRAHMQKYDDQANLVEKTIWRNFKGKRNPYKDQSEIGQTFFSNKPQDLE